MAAAEARAAWQRTANRCFVQEDAKRAPKLACVPPASSSLTKLVDTRPTTNGLDDFAPPSANTVYSNLSPESRWWLQSQSNFIYQKGLTNEKINTFEAGNSHQFVDIMDSQSTVKGDHVGEEESYEFVEMDSVDCCTVLKELDEFSLDSEFPHWMENEKNHELPWWRMTDKGDLASPLSTQSGDATAHEGSTTPGMDPAKWKLLEALRHSQTRAREAEKAAKQAYAEKEHVVKLIFKQASQLFAYKQWLYLLQLENLYNQIKTNKITPVFPVSPWQVARKKARRNLPPPSAKRKTRPKKGVPSCKHDIGTYAVAFAVGLGLVGAGLLLGWTVGWMFI
ncbi:hypothetical protein Ccrd_009001 [Cynara cardunculus var. scolymus]|uniref:Transmembrane protein n=1 Tax=Cynara cardunculus var. scolymus TaxID=59895 RepID=A0A118JSE1_CYNCS|nr:hypothetical protein Ccrd_009001 [Cynara cardunculus var. scolymus]